MSQRLKVQYTLHVLNKIIFHLPFVQDKLMVWFSLLVILSNNLKQIIYVHNIYNLCSTLYYIFNLLGAHLFCTGNLGPTQYVSVAIKNKVLIYELSRSKTRYERKKVTQRK